VVVNNSTSISKTNNHISYEAKKEKKNPQLSRYCCRIDTAQLCCITLHWQRSTVLYYIALTTFNCVVLHRIDNVQLRCITSHWQRSTVLYYIVFTMFNCVVLHRIDHVQLCCVERCQYDVIQHSWMLSIQCNTT
jgi:hypothetical protein